MWKAKSRSKRRFNILLTDKTIDEKQKYDGQNSTQHGMKTHEMHSVNDGETHTQHKTNKSYDLQTRTHAHERPIIKKETRTRSTEQPQTEAVARLLLPQWRQWPRLGVGQQRLQPCCLVSSGLCLARWLWEVGWSQHNIK